MMSNYEDWQERIRKYLHSIGKWDEDMASEMLLFMLEHPDIDHNMKIVYLRALDKIKPRTTCGQGNIKVYRDACDQYNRVDDVRTTPEGEEIRISDTTVVQFSDYAPVKPTKYAIASAKSAMHKVRYLARHRRGLPFVI